MALDIIFLSYDEPIADLMFDRLKERFPFAKRVHGVKGIAEAHFAAAEMSDTRLFYIVDADAEIFSSFDFSFKPSQYETSYVHIWKSRNPVNGLEYGYGGVKLFSKKFFTKIDEYIDFTTSLTEGVIYHNDVVSYTHFNSDPLRGWRGAFRECAKLAAQVALDSSDIESAERLKIWQTTAKSTAFNTEMVLAGAKDGTEFAAKNFDNFAEMSKVNDFDWLKKEFLARYSQII